jgi:hypothetical protein
MVLLCCSNLSSTLIIFKINGLKCQPLPNHIIIGSTLINSPHAYIFSCTAAQTIQLKKLQLEVLSNPTKREMLAKLLTKMISYKNMTTLNIDDVFKMDGKIVKSHV